MVSTLKPTLIVGWILSLEDMPVRIYSSDFVDVQLTLQLNYKLSVVPYEQTLSLLPCAEMRIRYCENLQFRLEENKALRDLSTAELVSN